MSTCSVRICTSNFTILYLQADAKLKQLIERLVGIGMAGKFNDFEGQQEVSLMLSLKQTCTASHLHLIR